MSFCQALKHFLTFKESVRGAHCEAHRPCPEVASAVHVYVKYFGSLPFFFAHVFNSFFFFFFLMSWLSGLAERPCKWELQRSVCMLTGDRHKLGGVWERRPLRNSCCAMCMTGLGRGKAGGFLINKCYSGQSHLVDAVMDYVPFT